tara:strand:+ start:43 stop:555 length:513 start_codon:yes stop_codon:yes gene_type:complete
MTKKLEEEFNLPPIEEVKKPEKEKVMPDHDEVFYESNEITEVDVAEVETALSTAEKIDHALRNVQGVEDHDVDMDDLAQQAVDSYQQLMNLGMNVSDRDAGSIFDSAAKMLKTALDAKDSKINSKLRQIDMMIKKARLDNNAGEYTSGDSSGNKMLDRNELLKIINNKEN